MAFYKNWCLVELQEGDEKKTWRHTRKKWKKSDYVSPVEAAHWDHYYSLN